MKSTAIEGLDSTNPEESKIVVLITDDSPSRSSEIKEPFDIISTKNTNAEPRDGDGVSVRWSIDRQSYTGTDESDSWSFMLWSQHGRQYIQYDDCDTEQLNMTREAWRFND